MTNRKFQLQKLVDRFRSDVNNVVVGMVTDALGLAPTKVPPKRGGALLQQELEASLSVSAQPKTKKSTKKTGKTRAKALRYQRAWRLKKKRSVGKPLSKAEEAWLKRYEASQKP